MQPQSIMREPLPLKGFLILFLVAEFSLLTHFPVELVRTVSDTTIMSITVFFAGYYFLRNIRNSQVPSILILFSPILLVPFISAIQANLAFGQPVIYGVLAERTKFLILSPVIIIYLLESGRLRFKTLESITIKTAAIYTLIALCLYLLVDPRLFSGTSFASVSFNKGVRYNINYALVIILWFYAIYKTIYERKFKYIPIIGIIFLYLLFIVQARSLMAALITSLGLSMLFKLDRKQKLTFISYAVPVLLVIALFVFSFYRDAFERMIDLFSSALGVFVGQEATDGSSASRLFQADIAWKGFLGHPWLGNGFLSRQFNDGFVGLFGRFYPSDIGWLGTLYLYGILGFMLLQIPYVAAFLFARKIPSHRKDVFYHAMESFMLYIFLHSIFADFSIKKIGMIAFPFLVIYYYRFCKSGQEELK